MMANQLVVVRYGRDGEQLAQMLAVKTVSSRRFVRKWLKNGRRWTGVVWVPVQHVLRLATPEDVKRFKPEFDV